MKFHRFCIRLSLFLLPGTILFSVSPLRATSFLQVQTQQSSYLSGEVTDRSGTPLQFVTIALKGSTMGTVTDAEGHFRLSVPAGDHTLRISAVGMQSQEVAVSLSKGQSVLLPAIQLAENVEELQEVAVYGSRENEFAEPESQYVAKMPLKKLENPQVYNTINARVLEQQLVTNLDDALKNAPGITKLWESTGRGGDGAAYYSLRGFAVQPKLMNGLPGLSNGALDPANIERIEVVKGPAGTLFGSSLVSYGGLINVVSKKPFEQSRTTLSYTGGSFGLNRLTADVNTPLSQDKSALLRINTALHSQKSFQDAGLKRSFFLAPSFSYTVNDRLSFLINTELLRSESTNQTMLFLDRRAPLSVESLDELGYDPNRSYTSNELTLSTPFFNLQGQMLYDLGRGWKSQTAVSRSIGESSGYYTYLYETSQYYPIDGVVFSRYMSKQNSATLTTDLQQNFTADLQLGNMRHRMLLGLDYYHQRVINNGTGYVANGNIYLGNAPLAEVNQTVFGIQDASRYESDFDSGRLSQAGADALLADASVNAATTRQEVYSAYVSDLIDLHPKVSVMAALRLDQFVNPDEPDNSQTTFSPKFGLVYQPVRNRLSVFANYLNGFSNVAPVIVEETTYNFDPEQANQWETGIKVSSRNELLEASLSYYQIQVSDKVRQELNAEGIPVYFQDGEIESKGLELDITANPLPGLNLLAGYSYNQTKNINIDPEFAGRRPENAGPEHLLNAWVNYMLPEGMLKGIGVGFGGNYGSEFSPMNRLTPGTFTLPAYTILNASLFYDAGNYRLGLKLNNLTDQEYYNGWSTLNPQQPRNLLVNATYRF